MGVYPSTVCILNKFKKNYLGNVYTQIAGAILAVDEIVSIQWHWACPTAFGMSNAITHFQ